MKFAQENSFLWEQREGGQRSLWLFSGMDSKHFCEAWLFPEFESVNDQSLRFVSPKADWRIRKLFWAKFLLLCLRVSLSEKISRMEGKDFPNNFLTIRFRFSSFLQRSNCLSEESRKRKNTEKPIQGEGPKILKFRKENFKENFFQKKEWWRWPSNLKSIWILGFVNGFLRMQKSIRILCDRIHFLPMDFFGESWIS